MRTLDDHLMILLNGPEIENFDYLKALEHWEGKKNKNQHYSEKLPWLHH